MSCNICNYPQVSHLCAPYPIMSCQDLSRRLASAKLLGGEEPGAIEALERLLNAILLKFEMAEPGEGKPPWELGKG